MKHQDFKHVIPIQIRFSDIDRLNHVNNSCYHNYFELGRVTYFNQVFERQVNWDKEGFILARTEIDHIAPVHLQDEVYCFTKVVSFGTKSLKIKNAIVKKVGNELIECAAGFGILVAMDYANNVSVEIPKEWRRLMEVYEKEG